MGGVASCASVVGRSRTLVTSFRGSGSGVQVNSVVHGVWSLPGGRSAGSSEVGDEGVVSDAVNTSGSVTVIDTGGRDNGVVSADRSGGHHVISAVRGGHSVRGGHVSGSGSDIGDGGVVNRHVVLGLNSGNSGESGN